MLEIGEIVITKDSSNVLRRGLTCMNSSYDDQKAKFLPKNSNR